METMFSMGSVPDLYKYEQYVNLSLQQLKIDQIGYSKGVASISKKFREENRQKTSAVQFACSD
jgi:hypothetical protein